jgi:hypothetical protein
LHGGWCEEDPTKHSISDHFALHRTTRRRYVAPQHTAMFAIEPRSFIMRQRHHHHGEEGEDSAVWTIVAFGLAALLMIGVAAVQIARSVEVGPHVGDIVSFRPGAQLGYAQETEIAVQQPEHAGGTCILRPAVVALRGGSLVVEAKEPSRPPSYRVHWAGVRTSNGATDCGANAELTLSMPDLLGLAEGAGGFGVHTDGWARVVGN